MRNQADRQYRLESEQRRPTACDEQRNISRSSASAAGRQRRCSSSSSSSKQAVLDSRSAQSPNRPATDYVQRTPNVTPISFVMIRLRLRLLPIHQFGDDHHPDGGNQGDPILMPFAPPSPSASPSASPSQSPAARPAATRPQQQPEQQQQQRPQ